MAFLEHLITLFLESAPWLLLGLVLAGLLKVWVPTNFMNQQLGGHGFKTTIKAALFGAPLPLCSCGVIPAAVGLRRAGASKAATTSFLVSTPETGIDSLFVSYVLLGPFMAIVRPIAAVFSAILAGVLVGKDEEALSGSQIEKKQEKATSCCSSTCCGSTPKTEEPKRIADKLGSALKAATTEFLDDTALWLIAGLIFAALVQAYLPDGFLAHWGDGLLAMLVMVVISIPMYICATASTPIAAGLLLAGVAPGAVLVFMMAGPATNIATLGVVAKELGKKALAGYLIGVLGGALFFGYLVDFLVARFDISVVPQIGPEHELLPGWLTLVCGVVLAVLIIISISKQISRRFLHHSHIHQHSH